MWAEAQVSTTLCKRTDMLKMVRSHFADTEEQTPIHCFQKVNTRKRGGGAGHYVYTGGHKEKSLP